MKGTAARAALLSPMSVEAQAREGFVTLTGTTRWHYQREAAELAATAMAAVMAG